MIYSQDIPFWSETLVHESDQLPVVFSVNNPVNEPTGQPQNPFNRHKTGLVCLPTVLYFDRRGTLSHLAGARTPLAGWTDKGSEEKLG